LLRDRGQGVDLHRGGWFRHHGAQPDDRGIRFDDCGTGFADCGGGFDDRGIRFDRSVTFDRSVRLNGLGIWLDRHNVGPVRRGAGIRITDRGCDFRSWCVRPDWFRKG
jgi:hypothetical protein